MLPPQSVITLVTVKHETASTGTSFAAAAVFFLKLFLGFEHHSRDLRLSLAGPFAHADSPQDSASTSALDLHHLLWLLS